MSLHADLLEREPNARALERVRRLETELEDLTDADLARLARRLREALQEELARREAPRLSQEARELRFQGKIAASGFIELQREKLELAVLDEIRPVALALAAEAACRVWRVRADDLSIRASELLSLGESVELEAGEERWLSVLLAAFVGALPGRGVHVAFGDGESARRERTRATPVLNLLGLSAGLVSHAASKAERRAAYRYDVTYASSETLALDHLEDGLVHDEKDRVQRGLAVAIVDDMDAALVDRAFAPLVLRAPDRDDGEPGKPRAATSVPSFFRLYARLAGTTATASWAADARRRLHGLEVVALPRGCRSDRRDLGDVLHDSDAALLAAFAREVEALHAIGRPVIVGAPIPRVDALSLALDARGIEHATVLGVNGPREEDVLLRAGELGRVTIATDRALRGVDVRLGTFAPWELLAHRKRAGAAPPDLREGMTSVRDLGGLHVVGIDRHRMTRLDAARLRELAGRRGEPGSSRFHASLEDPRLATIRARAESEGWAPGESVPARFLNAVQARFEERIFRVHERIVREEKLLSAARQQLAGEREGAVGWWSEPVRRLILDGIDEVWSEVLQELETADVLSLDNFSQGKASLESGCAVVEDLADRLRSRIAWICRALQY
ncbi:hypothetical protein HY251_07335, partial [bacterium]|nr:hypothetical protein [bacterium]